MATSLLAKLKVNKPPAIKKDMEIRIKGKADRKEKEVAAKTDKYLENEEGDIEGKMDIEGEMGIEGEGEGEDTEGDIVKKSKIKKPVVKFVDETKNEDFDREIFLKTFKRSKIVNEITPPVPDIVQQEKRQDVQGEEKKEEDHLIGVEEEETKDLIKGMIIKIENLKRKKVLNSKTRNHLKKKESFQKEDEILEINFD